MKSIVFGETVRGDACTDLARALEDGASFLRKHKTVPYVHFEMWDGLRELWKSGRTTTINEQAAKIYRKYGFDVDEQGIGWEIS